MGDDATVSDKEEEKEDIQIMVRKEGVSVQIYMPIEGLLLTQFFLGRGKMLLVTLVFLQSIEYLKL